MIVDDDRRTQRRLERMFIDSGYRVVKAETGEMVFDMVERVQFDLIIMEAHLPGLGGLDTLERLRATHPRLPVIIVAKTAATEDVIKASKLGAFDYVLKPFEQGLSKIVSLALETGRFMRSPVSIDRDPEEISGDNLVGRSQPMQEIYKAIGRVAPTDATVLIRGESGTGKELVARAIYQHSKRVNGPFVIVNCVAIPENLLESELFGYEKGAFTGADRQRIGKIEYADNGTVFLDEIGDIPLSIQAKLLRLLQGRSIERIGGKQPIQTDVRILAATNADLETKIKEGRFREDLYYRINVVSLNLPPLKKRLEDIPLLADYFMAKHSKNLGVRNPGILPEAKRILEGYDWPGNVRELANTIEKCLIFSKGRPVGGEEVSYLVSDQERAFFESPDNLDALIKTWILQNLSHGRSNLLADLTEHVTRLIIAEVLTACNGNRSLTAKRLGISRPTLLYKLKKYDLEKTIFGESGK
jgi:two-component system nitrogen regulation response regulator GlnG